MRSMKIIGIMLALIAILAACNSKEEEYLKLQKDFQGLKTQMALKDSVVNDFILSLNAIEQNLVLVRSKQNLIDEHTRAGAELAQDARIKIIKEIGIIDELLASNQDRIDAFKEELRRSNIRINSFRETINTLNDMLLTRESEMDTLKYKLIAMNLEVEELECLISGIQDESSVKDSIITDILDEMNEGYVAISDTRSLLERGVVEKVGGIFGIGSTITLSDSFDESSYNLVDIRETGGFSFNAKKAKLVSSHPEGSYELNGQNDLYSLVIEDPESFWSQSKLLVVATK